MIHKRLNIKTGKKVVQNFQQYTPHDGQTHKKQHIIEQIMKENKDLNGHDIVINNININHVEHFHYNDRQSSGVSSNNSAKDVEQSRQDIRMYVDKVRSLVSDKEAWPRIWNEVIVDDRLSDIILAVGKQKEATFNRSLVANIIHLLGADLKMIKNYNASKLADILEGNVNHSVRASLGMNPSDKEIVKVVREIFSHAHARN